MKLLSSLLNRNLFALAAFTAVLSPQVLKADSAQCMGGNAIQNGTYVLLETGTIAGVGPLAIVGLVHYDGQGGGTLISATVSVNGAVSKLTNIPATFTVNPDCTGSKTVGTGPSANHFDYIISPDGGTITFIDTDPNYIASGKAVRL